MKSKNEVNERRRKLLRMNKAELADLALGQQFPGSGECLRVNVCVAGRMVFAREVSVRREPGAVLCRSMIQLPGGESVRPVVMIGRTAADHESITMDLHQVRFQSGYVCKIRFHDDLFSVTLLRDKDAVWYTLWVNYDGPAQVAWQDWLAPDAGEDAAFQRRAAALQGMSESA